MCKFYDFKHQHRKIIVWNSHSVARPITSYYIHRQIQSVAKALHGNLNLFKGFVDVKARIDHHNAPF